MAQKRKHLEKLKNNYMILELKHLVPYLPYGLKGFYMDSDCDYQVEMEGLYEYEDIYNSEIGDIPMSYYIPILRPLSDLTKEIEVNGEKFVPIDRLYELRQTDIEFDFLRAIEDDWASANDKLEFAPYSINQKLFEWHFDVFGLIEKGLAIDINTLS